MRARYTTAVWMFERVGVDVGLAGDLLEECSRGRSTIWYWRQVLIAVWISVWGAIFDNKVLVFRAVATGYAVNAVWLFLWRNFLHLGLPERPTFSIEAIAYLSILLFTQAVTGWIVARTHRSRAIPMVFVFVIWLVLWYLGGTFSEASSIGPPQFGAYLAWYLAPISIEAVGLLLGAIVGAQPTPTRQPSPPTNPETV
jgi:hypothetical protein